MLNEVPLALPNTPPYTADHVGQEAPALKTAVPAPAYGTDDHKTAQLLSALRRYKESGY